MNLLDAEEGREYIIKNIVTDDEEMESFPVVSRVRGGCVVSIKDGRYNIDTDLAQAISI